MIDEAPKWINNWRKHKRRQRDGGQLWRPPLIAGVLVVLYVAFFCFAYIFAQWLFHR